MTKAPKKSQSDDSDLETKVLRRMLETPPKPHKPQQKTQGGSAKARRPRKAANAS